MRGTINKIQTKGNSTGETASVFIKYIGRTKKEAGGGKWEKPID